MKSVKFLIPVILLLSIASPLSGQEKSQSPKSNDVNTALIKNEESEMDWYVLMDTTKKEIGKVFTKTSRTADQLNITTTVKMNGMPDWVDETTAGLPKLNPVKHSSFNMQRDMVLNFGKQVTGYYLDKATNQKTEINETPNEDYFDSNIYPQLIRWLPLKENYKTVFTIFDYNPKSKTGVLTAHIQDTQKGIYKNTPVWIVKVLDDISENKITTTFYIDTKTRQLLKQEVDMGPRKMVMEKVN
ncbi:hypothetical protein KRE40_12785 [Elizabethkingia meningoseptica]|uniref:Outer membrane lipoprotein-sorting protein n=1 Tax=Elizabethkingia meningoseptica TaxID=238 RepID=A0A1T3J6K9_ELIME|nr:MULTISPECIES: hypothetical protein [Elizabethkingia]AQX11360.1 hypothetical protein BBD35_02725 [Elizabethkingia meningoseptica]MBG0512707.1 hypothetical protein [Elizabethkingia meningoseptica]MDE5435309.1 hypothetical protein [Elizabethkingia meningoseptica]MDE5438987.1 hypothetical protein [Elizabethkingia meningoseptica]MDE5450457.1 hypothetical protein [Elizabethkingia meningoseptica]